jgi:hypothetical protein
VCVPRDDGIAVPFNGDYLWITSFWKRDLACWQQLRIISELAVIQDLFIPDL